MSTFRHWHGLLATNIVLLGALIWTNAHTQTQPPVADVVRARLIELVNERGQMRAQLHVTENGGGQLRLSSGKGEIRVKFAATEDGAILLMLDGSTEPGVRLATEVAGPNLKLIDRRKGERVVAP